LKDLKAFRQLDSKTPGHPEYGDTPGIETTTGPLGQGLANAVGMALAERTLASQFNQDDISIVDHYTYVTVGDGCLMEGISHEASSLAGTLGLGKLIVLYDSNQISIDGDISGWYTEDVAARFEAYHWHVIREVDGHDPEQVKTALQQAQSITDKPSLLCCHTIIGWGSPNKQGKASSHGAPLGEDEVALVRETIGWHYPAFEIPEEQYQVWDAREKGEQKEAEWQQRFQAYQHKYPELAGEFLRRMSGELPHDWQSTCEKFIQSNIEKAENIASRKASQNTLEAFGPVLPELFGGSADLSGSNLTAWSGSNWLNHGPNNGNYLSYGVREFAMVALNSGMALHGGFLPYGGTFLVFSDYCRPSIRLAALMGLRVVFVMTHDSIGLGEDGPTHQPVEQLAVLRAIPNCLVFRPADVTETAECWQLALENEGSPSILALTRQDLKPMRLTYEADNLCARGAYEVAASEKGDAVISIFASGSEVELALEAKEKLDAAGHPARVVSVPCFELFAAQSSEYRKATIGDATVNVEIGRAHV